MAGKLEAERGGRRGHCSANNWLEDGKKSSRRPSLSLSSPSLLHLFSLPRLQPNAQGIHFTEAARSALGGRPQRPAATKGSRCLTLSTSLHSCAEVEAEAAAAAGAGAAATAQGGSPDPARCASSPCSSFDYVFLSPLFESISKPGYGGGRGDGTGASAKFWRSGGDDGQGSSSPSPALAAALLSARESPRRLGVVALGGVDASRLRLVSGLGFEAAAVLGAVWGGERDPVEAWAEVVEAAAAVNAAAAAAAAAAADAAPSSSAAAAAS